MNLDEKATRLRALLDSYVAAMKAGEPGVARDAAYEMLQLNQRLYFEAFAIESAQLKREGRQS